jgi:F-type H+-transporting ATPase subunit delta
MKINREARQNAKKLFRICTQNGQLDETKIRQLIRLLAEQKPRNYLGILSRLKKLVEIEVKNRTVNVQSAAELADRGAAILSQVEQQFGPALVRSYEVNPNLLGGLKIQVGSNVWDGSVRARLQKLEQSLN